MKNQLNILLYTCIGLLLLTSQVFADEPVSKSSFSNMAIGGHDTLAYYQKGLTSSRAVIEGKENFSVVWQGAKWQFSSQASADKFSADPSLYAPRYNGHCANALSMGEGLLPTNGNVWEFFGDKLHLFYSERGRQRWLNGDWKAYQAIADKAWVREL